VHQVAVEDVHFHEVGAVDAIVDIAGACIGLDWVCAERGVQAFRVGQIRVGRGVTRTEHGTMPVPAPAALHLLRDYPIHYGEAEGERVTPTGAALLATFAAPLGEGTPFRVQAVGSGAGTREFPDAPNVLRLLLCEVEAGEAEADAGGVQLARDAGASPTARITARAPDAAIGPLPATQSPAAAPDVARGAVGVLTTTIDDMVPEFYGHIMEKLFAAGALDVYYTPIYMKKGRPATQVTVIAEAGEMHQLADVLLNESSTLGVRIAYEERVELPRRMTGVETPYGWVEVKVAVRPDGKLRAVPEYESVRRAAAAAGVPLADVYRAALAADVDDEHGGRTHGS
jgi:pyridinium-3,5-bisthiocarboxylic acid mononucleotide nickel chelatase